MSVSGSNVRKLLRVANFCTRVNKIEHIFGTVIFQRFDKLKVYTLKKLKKISCFLHDIIKWLRVLIEKINFVKLGLKCSNFQSLMYQVRFARIARSNKFVKELSVLSGNNSPEALETNSIVSESKVK